MFEHDIVKQIKDAVFIMCHKWRVFVHIVYRSSTYHNPHTVGVLYYVFDLINYVSAHIVVCIYCVGILIHQFWGTHSCYLCCRHFSTSILLLLCFNTIYCSSIEFVFYVENLFWYRSFSSLPDEWKYYLKFVWNSQIKYKQITECTYID